MQNMVEKNEGPFRWDAQRPTRFWVLDRNATSSRDIRCFTYPEAMFVMHTAAAFEEGDVIFLYASAQPRVGPLRCSSLPPSALPWNGS